MVRFLNFSKKDLGSNPCLTVKLTDVSLGWSLSHKFIVGIKWGKLYVFP